MATVHARVEPTSMDPEHHLEASMPDPRAGIVAFSFDA
jgi:hypothetical protein